MKASDNALTAVVSRARDCFREREYQQRTKPPNHCVGLNPLDPILNRVHALEVAAVSLGH